MSYKVKASLAALALAALSSSAMAAPAVVAVNINVLPVVSMWSNDNSIQLTLSGADANNSHIVSSSLSVINNVDAKITTHVTGALPTPTVPGGGINFFLFPNTTPAAAASAIVANAYNPAGALAWNIATLGTTQTLVANTGVNTSIANVPLLYAADAPGDLPFVNDFNLTVTHTIIAN
jgi:hypothetical protein